MKIERRFTEAGRSPYDAIPFRQANSEIRNPDGSVVFQLESFDVPADWSQVAADVLAQKYFRKAGVPAVTKKVREKGVPSFLWRSTADEKALAELPEDQRYGSEKDARQVFDRLAGTWAYWGWRPAILPAKRMRAPISTRCATCSPARWQRRTARNGS